MKTNSTKIWDNGYFWNGTFKKGEDNSETLALTLDRLTSAQMQMSEKRSAQTSLQGYYTQMTGEPFPIKQQDRLNAWVSSGYDPDEARLYTDESLNKQRNYSTVRYIDETDAQTESFGRVKKAVIVFDEDKAL